MPPSTKPPGMDPRVLQMAIDAHGAEMEECVMAAADPTGKIKWLFAIASDGQALGVTVQEASANLKQAAECIAKKANGWKYPPSGSVCALTYSANFSRE